MPEVANAPLGLSILNCWRKLAGIISNAGPDRKRRALGWATSEVYAA